MSVKFRRTALIAVAVAAVAGCAPAAVAAPASAPSWHVVKRVDYNGSNGVFTAVTAVGRGDGWAFDGYSRATAWEWSQVASGHGLEGGSGQSASDIWAFDGADVAHWNGSAWSRTSVAALLPAQQQLNDPALTGIYEQSRHSVYAIANGRQEDEGGPLVILHWNGSAWSKVAGGDFGFGTLQQLASDGDGGLWLPMPGADGQKSYLLHYSDGHLTPAALPGGPSKITVDTVALIPGTTGLLGGGETHAPADQGTDVVGVVLEYGT